MSAPDLSAEAAHERVPEDLVEAGVYPTFARGFEHSIVVLALGHPCWLVPWEGGYRLLVEPAALAAARAQLVCFDRESLHWPPQPIAPDFPARDADFVTPLLWAVAVFAVFVFQGDRPGWVETGALDAQAVFDRGEWWRPATALFLHSNLEHLLSNLLAGVFVISALLSTVGRRRGWILLGLASLAGNIAAAALNYPGPYRSIGASTAIFAAIGLLTGRAIRVVGQSGHPHRWRTMFIPLAAGLTVLGLYGAGGVHVDVFAHLSGFTAGLIVGFAAAASRLRSAAARPPAP